jgi:hypothetical protein
MGRPRLKLSCSPWEFQVWDLQEHRTQGLHIEFLPVSDGLVFHPEDPPDPLCLLDGILHRMNHQDLQVLDLHFALSTQSWMKFFGKLPLLSSICIYQGEQEFFAPLINGTEDVPEHRNMSTALPFQALESVEVGIRRDGRRREPYSEEAMMFMLECLRERKKRGTTLKILSFITVGAEGLRSQLNGFRCVVRRLDVVKVIGR